jgi:hypothetical protein
MIDVAAIPRVIREAARIVRVLLLVKEARRIFVRRGMPGQTVIGMVGAACRQ